MAEKGQIARFLYKGSFPDGEVFDDCNGEPYEIVLGRHQVMRALDDALLEMNPGDERTIKLPAKEAYGEYNEDAVQKFPAYKVPNGENLPVGETIGWTSPRNVEPIPAKVVSGWFLKFSIISPICAAPSTPFKVIPNAPSK